MWANIGNALCSAPQSFADAHYYLSDRESRKEKSGELFVTAFG